MPQTDLTLLEQMRMTEIDIDFRKALFGITTDDAALMAACRPALSAALPELVDRFYEAQTSVPEIALLIGDADTLRRLRQAQHGYIRDLFSGDYGVDYVNGRLRIGMVHKRIGVEPKLYLAAMYTLKGLLLGFVRETVPDANIRARTEAALEKLVLFDVGLVFDTYIRSLVSAIEASRNLSEQYARSLEAKVRERTEQLEQLSRTDALTGLLNVRSFIPELTQALRMATRRGEPTCLLFIDVNDFKQINDTQGHPAGDAVLQGVAQALRAVSREDDRSFRYGGDEFCVVLPNCSVAQAEAQYVPRLRAQMRDRYPDVTLSVGLAEAQPQAAVAAKDLIQQADTQMYAAKQAWRERKT